MNTPNTSSVSSDEKQKNTPYNATTSKNITPHPTLLSALFNPKPTPKPLHDHSISGDYLHRQQKLALVQHPSEKLQVSNVVKQQNNDNSVVHHNPPAYHSHSPMFLDGNRYYEQWHSYLHENQMLSPSVQDSSPPSAHAAGSGDHTSSKPAANGTWQSRMMQHENQMLSSSVRGGFVPLYATKSDDLSVQYQMTQVASNVPSKSDDRERHHMDSSLLSSIDPGTLLQQQLALLKEIEVSSDFVQATSTQGDTVQGNQAIGTGKSKRGRPRVMEKKKKKKKTKKRTVTKKAGSGMKVKRQFEPTPSQKERINTAIHSVNAKYGCGVEKLKKLAMVNLKGVSQRPSMKWQAQIYFAGKTRYIGVFESREDASLAYEVAKEVLRSEDVDNPLTEEEVAREVSVARIAAFTIIAPVEEEHSGK